MLRAPTPFAKYLVKLSLSLLYAGLAFLMVYLVPTSAGSGIPETKVQGGNGGWTGWLAADRLVFACTGAAGGGHGGGGADCQAFLNGIRIPNMQSLRTLTAKVGRSHPNPQTVKPACLPVCLPCCCWSFLVMSMLCACLSVSLYVGTGHGVRRLGRTASR